MTDPLRWIETCDAEVTRDGRAEPCEKTAVAMVLDDEGERPWAVCASHTRGRRLIPLSRIVAWAKETP